MLDDVREMLWFDAPVVCIDTETTGFDSDDRVIELAAVTAIGGRVVDTYVQRFNPGILIPPDATAVHGIGDEDVRDCPSFESALPQVLAELCRAPWVIHNADFDLRMLHHEIPAESWPQGIPVLCTMHYARTRHPELKLRRKGHRLVDVARHTGVEFDYAKAHGALYDAQILAQVMPRLVGDLEVTRCTGMSEEW